MEKINKFLVKNAWIFILVLCLPVVWSLFRSGYFGASDDMHIAWLFEMDRAFGLGQFPPRYVPDLSYGFGYPLFNFVFPLPFYLGEIIHLIGFSFVDSVKGVLLLSLVLSFLTMYLFLRKFSGVLISLLGAVIYTYAPYRATDVYIRGAIGESFAFVFYPLITLSLMGLLEDKNGRVRWKWIGIGALSISGLVMSHNISAYMFMPAAALLAAIAFIYSKKKKPLLLNYCLTIVFGLLISIYFWLPALMDSGYMTFDTVFNFVDHFPTIRQLITPYFGYGASVPGPGDGMSFFLGAGVLISFVLGLWFFLKNYKVLSINRKVLLSWAIVTFLVSIFMMNHRSTIVWENIPFIAYFQFPWRFLALSVFSASIFVITLDDTKLGKLFAWGLLILTIGVGFYYFKPQDFLGRLDDYYINRYVPYPQASEEYKKTGEEYLRLPASTLVRPDQSYPEVFGEGVDIINLKASNPLAIEADLKVEQNALVSINKYNFPGWEAYLDGQRVEIQNGEPFGQIQMKISGGEHKIVVAYRETARNKVLDLVSFLSLVSLVMLMAI